MDPTDIQLRLYRAILYTCALLSLISIFGNLISSFPFRISLKWILLLIICALAFFISRNKKHRPNMMFAFFIFLIFMFLPFAFTDLGGSNNNSIGYSFLLIIGITYLFTDWRRLFLVFSLISIMVILLVLEYHYPFLIMEYSEASQFTDRIFQVPLLLLTAFFAIQIFAMEYERVLSELDKYAKYDALTQLYNRRMFNMAMEQAIADPKSTAHLALIDMDNFKTINDRYGHSVGDEVLRKFASLLLDTFEKGHHIVSRWGGDEFAVIYYGDEKSLYECLRQVRSDFRSYLIHFQAGTDITFSITPVKESNRIDQILVRADGSLYQQKRKKKSGGRPPFENH